jgi:hypothetical protein
MLQETPRALRALPYLFVRDDNENAASEPMTLISDVAPAPLHANHRAGIIALKA